MVKIYNAINLIESITGKKVLLEGWKEIDELNQLADEIMIHINFENPKFIYLFNVIDESKYSLLKELIYSVKIEFKELPEKTNGEYTHYYKSVVINKNILQDKKKVKETLVHELQHSYDFFRSKEKVVDLKKNSEFYKKSNSKEILTKEEIESLNKKYLKLPLEYWARFSEFVINIDWNEIYNFNELKKQFEMFFRGYDILKEKDKKRLLNSLYKIYQIKKMN